MMLSRIIVAASIATAAAAPAAIPDVKGKWIVDFEEDQCTVLRKTEGSQSVFGFRTLPGSNAFQIVVIDPAMKSLADLPASSLVDVILSAGSSQLTGSASIIEYKMGWAISVAELDTAALDQLAAASSFELKHGAKRLFRSNLPSSTRAAVERLRWCEDGILRTWGIDPAERVGLRKPPKPIERIVSVFREQDYPGEALRKGVSGRVIARLTVGPDGRVANCVPVSSSGDASLDRTTCRILTSRARFEPALGEAGAPVAATIIAKVSWRAWS